MFEIFGNTGTGPGEAFFLVPAAVSLLTRPTSILVELQDPDAVRAEVSRLATGSRRYDAGFLGVSMTMYGVGREDEWACTQPTSSLGDPAATADAPGAR